VSGPRQARPDPGGRRLLALKALCEARLDREDVRERIEAALQPARAAAAAVRRGEPPPPALADFRRAPLGTDSSGFTYWYLDLGRATGAPARRRRARRARRRSLPRRPRAPHVRGSRAILCARASSKAWWGGAGCARAPPGPGAAGDVRLYREAPTAPAPAKGRGSKARGKRAPPPPAGAWELLAGDADALRAAGERLRRNKQRPEQRLATQARGGPRPAPPRGADTVSRVALTLGHADWVRR